VQPQVFLDSTLHGEGGPDAAVAISAPSVLLESQRRLEPPGPSPSRESGEALLHHIKGGEAEVPTCRRRPLRARRRSENTMELAGRQAAGLDALLLPVRQSVCPRYRPRQDGSGQPHRRCNCVCLTVPACPRGANGHEDLAPLAAPGRSRNPDLRFVPWPT
jgi:hypothetical protein